MLEKIKKIVMNKDNWLIGLFVGAISAAITFLMGVINFPKLVLTFSTIDVNLQQQLQQGISTDLGGKAMSLIGGYIPLTLPGIITVLVSGALLFMIGKILYDVTPLPKGKNVMQRTALTLLYGTVIVGFILAMSFKAFAIGTIVALAIYYAIIAFVMTQLAKKGIIKVPL